MTTLDGIQDGEVLKSVTGKLTAVYDSETKSGEFGEYTSQNCELTLADKKKYKLSLMNHVIPKSAKGKMVTLSSQMVEKKGYQGVQFVIETYISKKGTPEAKQVSKDVIKVNAKGVIEYPDGAPAEKAQTQGNSSASAGQQPKPNRRLEQVTELDQPESYSQVIEQLGLLHLECNLIVRKIYADDNLPEESLRANVQTIFIESNKMGYTHQFLKFRKGDVTPEPKKQDEGEPWVAEGDENVNETEQGEAAATQAEEVPEEVPAEETAPENPFKDWEKAKIPSGPKEGKTLAEVGKVTITKYYEAYAKTGFKTDFQKYVLQAAKDLNIHKDEEEDSIPY